MEKDIQLSNTLLHYNESGPNSGVPIILMHGWGCNFTTLTSIENILKDSLHVYNIDLPGFGKSPEPNAVWGVDDYTKVIEEFISKLNILNPILLGHSFGGRITLLLSSRNQIRKNILVDAAGVKPRHSLKWYFKVYTYKLAKKIYPLIFGDKKAQEKIDATRKSKGSSDYINATPMMRAILSKCVNEDLCHVMSQIKASTLLIWGKNDTATPLSDAKKIENLIPDAGLVSFAGCGHYSFLDNPVGFKAVIKEFLKNEMK